MKIVTELPNELPENGYKGPERRALNQIIRALRRVDLAPSKDLVIKTGPRGTTIELAPGIGGNGNNSGKPRWL